MKKEGGREANYKCVTSTTSRLTTGYSSQSHTSSTTCYGTIEFHQLKNRYEYLFHARFREHHAQSSQQHLVTLTLIAACLIKHFQEERKKEKKKRKWKKEEKMRKGTMQNM